MTNASVTSRTATMKRRMFLRFAASGSLAAPAIGRAQARTILKFVPQADLTVLDPVFAPAVVTRNHAYMVFDQLFALDDSYRAQPQMLEGHVVENDGLTWKLTLREGLRFHDDTPVLARDAAASIERWAPRDSFGQTLRAATEEVSAPSDRVVQIRLKKPFPMLPFALARGALVMPERLARTPGTVQVTEMTGSGPFRFLAAERVSGARVAYERWPGYVPRSGGTASFAAGPKIAYVDRVEWHTIPDGATAAAALQAGEVDWLNEPAADLLSMLGRHRDITVEVKDKGGIVGMIRFNHLNPPFDNPAIRQALLGGIVQSDFMIAAIGDDRTLWRDQCGFLPPNSPFASDTGMEAITVKPDLGRVKAALAAAGYRGARVVLLAPTDIPALRAMGEVAADMFRRVGLEVEYPALDWGTVLQRIANREAVEKGGWNACALTVPGQLAANPATHSYMRGLGKAGPAFGWPESRAYEELFSRFMDTPDEAGQQTIARQMQAEAFRNVPYLPTGLWFQPYAFRRNITGILNGFPLFHNVKKG